jgi:hypothetical protein
MAFANASNTVYDLCLLPDKIVEDTSMVVVIGGVFKRMPGLTLSPRLGINGVQRRRAPQLQCVHCEANPPTLFHLPMHSMLTF